MSRQDQFRPAPWEKALSLVGLTFFLWFGVWLVWAWAVSPLLRSIVRNALGV